MYLQRHLVDILIATVNFLSNNKIFYAESFFTISNFQKSVKGMISSILNKQVFLNILLTNDSAAYQDNARWPL